MWIADCQGFFGFQATSIHQFLQADFKSRSVRAYFFVVVQTKATVQEIKCQIYHHEFTISFLSFFAISFVVVGFTSIKFKRRFTAAARVVVLL